MVTNTPITGNGNLVSGLGGSDGYGELTHIRDDDGFESFDLTSVFGTQGLTIDGVVYTSLFVNINGSVSFGNGISQYTPSSIPNATTPMIAPFWADIDTRTNGVGPESGNIHVDMDTAKSVLTVTWDHVGYFDFNADLTNTFQLQLFNRGSGNFDIAFRYDDIQWTAGDYSGGTGGLGGTPARGGYSLGDGVNFFELPQAGDGAALVELENTAGNTGTVGLWAWHVGDGQFENLGLNNRNDQAPRTMANSLDEIQAASLFMRAVYGEANIDVAYRGTNDNGFDDNYEGYLGLASNGGWDILHADTPLAGIGNYFTGPNSVPDTSFFESNGLYHNGTAEALLARNVSGTLILSYRGSDDGLNSIFLGEADTGEGQRLYYIWLQPLIDAAYEYAADALNGITNIVVTGHSLGGSMVDLFTVVDGNRFAALENSELTIVSFASAGLDPDAFGGGFIRSVDYDPSSLNDRENRPLSLWGTIDSTVASYDEANQSIILDTPSNYYIGISHNQDRVHFTASDAAANANQLDTPSETLTMIGPDNLFNPVGTISDQSRFDSDFVLKLPNILNGDVDYDSSLGPDHGFGAHHNSGIYWHNVNALTKSDLIARYANHHLIFGTGNYAFTADWFSGSANDILATRLIGTATDDFILGLEGTDMLSGRAGRDLLDGGLGNDKIDGGAGRDFMAGGGNHDVFVFTSILDAGRNGTRDVIVDFRRGSSAASDDIDLSRIDAKIGVSRNNEFTFIGSQGFHGVKGELRYTLVNVSNNTFDKTIVEGDINGDGRADFQIELKGLIKLTAGDFVL